MFCKLGHGAQTTSVKIWLKCQGIFTRECRMLVCPSVRLSHSAIV